MKKKKRNKFSKEDKERIVLSILKEGSDCYHSIARKHNTCPRSISLWVNSYKVHGITGLSFKNNLNYSGEFKLKLVQEMISEGQSLRQSSVKYQISPSLLSTWRRGYKEGGVSALFMDKRKGRPPKARNKQKTTQDSSPTKEEQLMKKNELLRAEDD